MNSLDDYNDWLKDAWDRFEDAANERNGDDDEPSAVTE